MSTGMSGQGGRGWQTVSEKYKGTPPQCGHTEENRVGMLWWRALTGVTEVRLP